MLGGNLGSLLYGDVSVMIVSRILFCYRNLVLDGNVADEQNWYELITEESP